MLNKSEVATLLSDHIQIRHGQDDAAIMSILSPYYYNDPLLLSLRTLRE